MFTKLLVKLDKFLGTLGEKKAQKGMAVAAVTTPILYLFPDFPQEALTKAIELVIELINLLGQLWVVTGIIHQFVKDRILNRGIIPPSVEKRAEETGKPVVVITKNLPGQK